MEDACPRSGRQRILALSDGKPGHFHQTRGILERLPEFDADTVDIAFHSKRADNALRAKVAVGRSLITPGAARSWLAAALTPESHQALDAIAAPDIVLSTGSSVAPVNLLVARLHQAKAAVVNRPSPIGCGLFDLAILPRHQWQHGDGTSARVLGAPTHVTPHGVAELREGLVVAGVASAGEAIGLLFGGNDRRYTWSLDAARKVVESLIAVANRSGRRIAVATSRRTPDDVADYVRSRLTQSPVCVYSAFPDDDPPKQDVVPTVLAHSLWTAVTVDSFSMVCEAASGGAPVGLVEIPPRRPDRYAVTYDAIAEHTRLTRMRVDTLYDAATSMTQSPPEARPLDDAGTAARAISQLASASG